MQTENKPSGTCTDQCMASLPDGPVRHAMIFKKAYKAGQEAGQTLAPRPMGITDGVTTWVASEGPCGFAWVNVRPGNSSFSRWLKKTDRASKAYRGGVDIWIGDFNQSMTRKMACAQVMAEVLREAGIKAYAGSRMD